MNKQEEGMLERLKLRAEAHRRQAMAYGSLIVNIKPDWFKARDDGLSPADDPEHPIYLIDEMFNEADKAWNDLGDWEKALDDAEQIFIKNMEKTED